MRGEGYKVENGDVDETLTFLHIELLGLRVGIHFHLPLIPLKKYNHLYSITRTK